MRLISEYLDAQPPDLSEGRLQSRLWIGNFIREAGHCLLQSKAGHKPDTALWPSIDRCQIPTSFKALGLRRFEGFYRSDKGGCRSRSPKWQ
jgi:hypothetical protein